MVSTDVADPESCEALAQATLAEFGRLDVLVNNAGIGAAVPATREAPAEFRRVIDINLNGAYWAAKSCGRVMQPGTSIVNISRVLAFIKPYGPQAAYAARKAAIIGLTRDLAQQWSGRRGIRVNAVAPGYFATEMTAGIPEDLLPFIRQHSPLGRLGTQSELDADGGSAAAKAGRATVRDQRSAPAAHRVASMRNCSTPPGTPKDSSAATADAS